MQQFCYIISSIIKIYWGYQKFKTSLNFQFTHYLSQKKMTLNVCTYHVLTVTVVIEDCFFKLIESQITMIFFFLQI